MNHSVVLFGATGVLVLVGAIVFRPSADVPRVPAASDEILERLPTASGDPRERQRKTLERALAAHPDDLPTALTVAHLDIELSRKHSDPRYLGYAQAALAPWWDETAPPSDVLVLRATVRQSLHDFEGALADLDREVALRPDDAQAWITRAVVLTVRGRYEEAMASCRSLARQVPALDTAVCRASILGVTGQAAAAYEQLAAALRGASRVSADETEWALSNLAEIAVRLGRTAEGEQHFRAALAVDPDDPYVLAAYADFLLDAGRPLEAAKLLAQRTDDDGLLLRLALAEKASRSPQADAHAALLGARFAAMRMRGDTVHRREEARYELELAGNGRAAAALASANWTVQHEPWDMRILLEAALAAGDPALAAPALTFLDANHLEGPRIAALAAKLRKAAP